MSSLSGCTALVTGAGRRLGRSIALALSEEGVHVVIHHHASGAGALEVASLVRSKGVKAWTVEGDLSDPARASDVFDEACACAGPIDFLVNSAAVYPEERLEGISIASLEEALKINALSPLSLITAFVRQKREGAVVNILDARMTDYDRMHPGYEASKHLLFSFTRMAALEWAPLVRVNAVAPGFIRFDEGPPEGVRSSGRDSEALSAAAAPLKRTPFAAEVAEASIFLLRSASITGQVLFVDGGRHLKGRVFSI